VIDEECVKKAWIHMFLSHYADAVQLVGAKKFHPSLDESLLLISPRPLNYTLYKQSPSGYIHKYFEFVYSRQEGNKFHLQKAAYYSNL